MRASAGVTVVVAMLVASSNGAAQKFVSGFFVGTESGTPIELIAWAEADRATLFRMANSGSLEDAPILPRTYRALLNLGSFEPLGVLATTQQVFSKPLDRIEHRDLKFSVTRLAVTTYEIAVRDLEDWEKVQRLRRSVKATADNPMILFFAVTNGVVIRYYPFFIERH